MRMQNCLTAILAAACMGCNALPTGRGHLDAIADSLLAGRKGSVCHSPAEFFTHDGGPYTSCELVIADTIIGVLTAPDTRVVFAAKTWRASSSAGSLALRQVIEKERSSSGPGYSVCVVPEDSFSIQWKFTGYFVTAYSEASIRRIGVSFADSAFAPRRVCRP
jgi:hypothetical protein